MKILIDYYIDTKTKQKIYKMNNKNIFFLKKYKEIILKKKKELKKKRLKNKKLSKKRLSEKKKNIQPIIHKIETKQQLNIELTDDEDLPLSFYLENSTDYLEDDINIDYSEILERNTPTQNKIESKENEKEKVLIQSKPEEKIIENENLFQKNLDKIKAKQNKISKQIRRKQLKLLEKERIKKINQKKEVYIKYNKTLNKKKNIEEPIQEEEKKVIKDNIPYVSNIKKTKQKEDKLYSIEDEGFEVKDSYGKVDGLHYKVDINSTIEVPIVQDEDNKIFLKIPKEGTFNKYLNVFIGTFNPDKRTIYLPNKGKYDMRFIRWIYEEKKKYIKMKNSNFYNM